MLDALRRGRLRFFGPGHLPTQCHRRRAAFYAPQHHGHLELILALSGRAQVYANTGWRVYRPGKVWVFLPGAVHSERYDRARNSYRILWMSPSPGGVGFHVTAYDPGRGYHLVGKRLALQLPLRDDLLRLAGQTSLHRDRLGKIHFQSQLMDVLCRVMPHMDNISDTEVKIPFHRQTVERVRAYLDQNYTEDMNLTDLAGMVHYSPCHLNLLFRQQVGVPIRQYVLQKRIAQADKLLKATDMEIKQIAYSVGFRDPLYFSRVFRKLQAVPPIRRRV